ncbi:MAG: proline racemase family protein, partial [Candidatus Eisenbacteria bacterium]|nr:proline racemase family protein [Candidatus Eisenbacteria bacterium]
MQRVSVIDSHTAGEPTRVVLAGGPDLGAGSLAARRERFRTEHDRFRSAVTNEPRGSDPLVGALLVPPESAASDFGVIFFNNVGYLGMCVHGTIGLVVTLAHLGRIRPGAHRIDTPVGPVTATLYESGEVSVRNVPSRRTAKGVALEVPGVGAVRGDVAWGGNWFFLIQEHDERLELANVERLTAVTSAVFDALRADGIRGDGGAEIDHIELFDRSTVADSRNFVLCPGRQYDRSPCGTGTSAKLACLWADGALQPGQTWRQESIIGSIFEGRIELPDPRDIDRGAAGPDA